jgi:hypothetical protein
LLSITIHAARPPRCGEGAFDGVSKSIPVYVPCGSLASYKKSEWWSGYFTNMMEDCGWGSAAGTFAQYARAQETEETMVRG